MKPILEKTIITLILVILPYIVCMGDNTNVGFNILKSENIQTGEISDLYQDSEGYIWIVANDGLERYDGHNSIPFISLKNNEEILGSQLHTIIEGENGFLYVATERGLIKLNKTTAESHLIKDKNLDRINISSMAKDKDGRIWIGCDKGLIMKSSSSDEFTKIDLWTGTKSISDITSLLVDSKNNLWFTIWYDGLYRYDLSNGKFFKYTHGSLDKAYTTHEDSYGNIWVGTWGKGLIKIASGTDLSREDIGYTLYEHNPHYEKSLIDGTIYKIRESPDGNIWIGSRSGLSILDPQNENLGFVNYLPGNEKGDLPYNEVNCLLRTKDNAMFVGMMGGGVCKAEKKQKDMPGPPMEKIQKRFNTSSIYGITDNGDGTLWLGIASHGPVKFDINSGNFKYYLDIPLFKGYFGTSTVEEIIYSKDSTKVYFASYNRGLWIHDIEKNSVSVVNTTTCPDLKDDCLYALCEDNNSNLWIGTKKGIYVMNAGGKVCSMSEYLGSGPSNAEYKATDIACDISGDIWIATSYSGILRIDTFGKTLKIYRNSDYPEGDSFISILADSKGGVRAGSTRNGLYKYDPEQDKMVKESELAFLDSEEVVNLCEDPHGHIWATTQTSVISFMDDSHGSYSELRYWNISEDGKAQFFNNNSSVWLRDKDEMAFGTSKGILTYPCMQKNCTENEDCKIALTSIKSTEKRLTLPKGSTEFTVNFTLFNYQRPSGDIYRYRLYRGGRKKINHGWWSTETTILHTSKG